MLGSHYEQKPLDPSEFYIPSPKAFPWIISCRVQHVEQWDLKFGGGRFRYNGIIWDVNIRREDGHGPQTFSALQGQTQHNSPTLVTTPRVCARAVPRVHTLNTAGGGTHCLPQSGGLDYVRGKPGWKEGKKEGCWAPASCPCMKLGDSQSLYQSQELKCTSQKYFSKQRAQIFLPVVIANGSESWRK